MDETELESGKRQIVFKNKTSTQLENLKPLDPPWKILVVDDDEQVHILTKEVLRDFIFEGRPLLLLSGYSGQEAKSLLKTHHHDTALLLLDVIMETSHAGLDVVKFIREELGNHHLRILLRTGQAGQFPEEKIFEEYDINNFLDKTDLTSRRLKMAIKVALRTSRDIQELDLARKREAVLRQAADAASQAKTNFLHMMSHELRTPLQGTKGPFEEFKSQFHLFVGMKKLTALINTLGDATLKAQLIAATAEIREEVADIATQGLKSVEHLLGLIEDVLDFARIEAGKLRLTIVPHALLQIVHDVVDTMRPMAEQRGLVLETHLPQQDLIVLADGKRLKQILFNLLGNAIKFTAQGTVSLTVARVGQQVFFSVEDSGCGIPQEKLAIIFEAFEQVDNSATRHVGGTGLGLPITRELVRKQGGEIQVQSILGQGSLFSFTLPLVDAV
ncbi:MAG: hypothetical protein HQL87_18430 [Magnetococcales bacterium]|nr:hypothetical protein [Magnetococcales bacterium]